MAYPNPTTEHPNMQHGRHNLNGNPGPSQHQSPPSTTPGASGLSTVQHNDGVPGVQNGFERFNFPEGTGFVEAWAMQNAVYTMRNPDNCVGSPRFANMAFGDAGQTLEGELFKRIREPLLDPASANLPAEDGSPSPMGPSPIGNRTGAFGSGRRRVQAPGWEGHSPMQSGTGRSQQGGGYSGWDDQSPMAGNSFRASKSGLSQTNDFHQTGPLSSKLPQPLPRTEVSGGMTTVDFGATALLDQHDTVALFVDTPVQYKIGLNVMLHQWEDCPDVLVSCHSRWPQAFICQYGIDRGILEWGIDISRTCDMLWVGVTANPELDCNEWICDQPDTFLVSEESTILADVYKSYVGGAAVPFPSLIPAVDGPGTMKFLVDFGPTDVGGFWCAASFRLDMDAGELWMEVAEGGGTFSERVLVFQNLPRGKKLYPCLSMCNAGQIVFTKHG